MVQRCSSDERSGERQEVIVGGRGVDGGGALGLGVGELSDEVGIVEDAGVEQRVRRREHLRQAQRQGAERSEREREQERERERGREREGERERERERSCAGLELRWRRGEAMQKLEEEESGREGKLCLLPARLLCTAQHMRGGPQFLNKVIQI